MNTSGFIPGLYDYVHVWRQNFFEEQISCDLVLVKKLVKKQNLVLVLVSQLKKKNGY